MASTKEDFLAALEKADKAGDTEAAKEIAAEYKKRFMSDEQPQQSDVPVFQEGAGSEDMNIGESAGAAASGLVEGASAGFVGPEEQASFLAAGETGIDLLNATVRGFIGEAAKGTLDNPQPSATELYRQNKKEIEESIKRARVHNPYLTKGADIAGTIASSVYASGAWAARGGAFAASLAGKMAFNGGVSLVHGIGRSDEDTIAGMAEVAAKEGAIGAAFELLPPAAKVIGKKAAPALAPTLQKVQGSALIKFLGDKYSTVEENLRRHGKKVIDWADRMVEYTDDSGQLLMDPLKSRQALLEGVENARKETWAKQHNILSQVDDQYVGGIDGEGLYIDLKEDLIDPILTGIDSTSTETAAAKKIKDFLKDTLISKKTTKVVTDPKTGIPAEQVDIEWKELSLLDLHTFKKKFHNMAAKYIHRADNPLEETYHGMKFDLGTKVGNRIDDYLEASSDFMASDNLQLYKQLNNKYGDLKEASKALKNSMGDQGEDFLAKLARDRVISMTSIGGGALSMMGIPVGPALLAVGGLRAIAMSKRVNGAVAMSAKNLINKLSASPERYARIGTRLLTAMNSSGKHFMAEFEQASAEVDLMENPLARDSQEVIRRSGAIMTVMQSFDRQAADDLRKAIMENDHESIATIMSTIAAKAPGGFIKPGIGWGNKVYTQEDAAKVNGMINAIQNTRKKMILHNSFNNQASDTYRQIPEELLKPKQEPMNHFIYRKRNNKVTNPEY
jgi:hypothetical protein